MPVANPTWDRDGQMPIPLLFRILQLKAPIITVSASGGLKHKTHSEHGIVVQLGPLKTSILQP
jgi:hypothetical protein